MTGLRARLAKLEREISHRVTHACSACGGPKPGFDRTVAFNANDERVDPYDATKLIETCSACGLALDAKGESQAGAVLETPSQPRKRTVLVLFDESSS